MSDQLDAEIAAWLRQVVSLWQDNAQRMQNNDFSRVDEIPLPKTCRSLNAIFERCNQIADAIENQSLNVLPQKSHLQ